MRAVDADEMLNEVLSIIEFRKKHCMETKDYESFARFIEERPTIDPAKCGKWMKDGYNKDPYCNVCGGIAPVDCTKESFYESDYCQSCGARMDGE